MDNNTVKALVEFDFTSFYEHYPSGIVLSVDNNGKVETESEYIDSDSATEMLTFFNQWLEKYPAINWFISTFVIKYTTGSVFAPTISLELTYRDIYNLFHEVCSNKLRTEKDINNMIAQNITLEWESTNDVKQILMYLIDFFKDKLANIDDGK